ASSKIASPAIKTGKILLVPAFLSSPCWKSLLGHRRAYKRKQELRHASANLSASRRSVPLCALQNRANRDGSPTSYLLPIHCGGMICSGFLTCRRPHRNESQPNQSYLRSLTVRGRARSPRE